MSSNSRIPFINPAMPSSEEVREDYEQIHKNNFYSNNGPFYKKFVREIESYLGSDVSVVGLANATLGLIMALKWLAKEDRKYVIVPSFTFAAGPQSILWAGYEPYFVDIERDTFGLKISQIIELLESESIAAILLCNPFGIGLTDIADYEALSKKYEVPLIIDSAAGFGSTYDGVEKLGKRGSCEIFSFHATKPFGISEGGIISSKDRKLIENFEQMKNFGFNSERDPEFIGFNAKIAEMQCAIGLRMLPRFDERLNKRQEIYRGFYEPLVDSGIGLIQNAHNSSLCFASIILGDTWSKDALMESFGKANIEVRDYYNPKLHESVVFKKFPHADMSNTNSYSKCMVSLPIDESMESSDINRIIEVVRLFVRG